MKKKKKLRLLCDIDGIAADFVSRSIEVMNEVSNQSIIEEDITAWEVTDVLINEEHRSIAKDRFNQKGFCLSIKPYFHSKEAIRVLYETTDFHFVTAPLKKNKYWMHERVEWVDIHFGIPHDRVHFVSEKYITSGDIFIDDAEKNINSWIEHNPNGKALIWDRPWNRASVVHPEAIRVNSWIDVINKVCELTKI